ncbi:MAG: tetratricopeptide repeat protein [Planctomycetes bacterium]|nr:tetratricopeptide repeat protein [Planctomycetota bacterium]
MNLRPDKTGGMIVNRTISRRVIQPRMRHSRLMAVGLLIGACGCSLVQRSPVPKDVAAARELSYRGLDAMQKEHWNEAELMFARAVEACPTDERARQRYGEMLWRRGESADAIKHMTEAVRLSGGDPELHVRLGEMFLAQENLDKAQEQAETAIRAKGELPSAWSLHGDIFARRGQVEEALASYHRALSYQGHFPHVQLAVARIYGQEGRPSRMLSTLDGLVENYAPGQAPQEALLLQGLALKSLQRYDEAIQCLTLACRGSSNTEALFHLSDAQWRSGDLANANLSLARLLATKPRYAPALQLRQEIMNQQGRRVAVQPKN